MLDLWLDTLAACLGCRPYTRARSAGCTVPAMLSEQLSASDFLYCVCTSCVHLLSLGAVTAIAADNPDAYVWNLLIGTAVVMHA